ncbi:hypothetical protein VPHK45_0017 [Vibrio phage K45]
MSPSTIYQTKSVFVWSQTKKPLHNPDNQRHPICLVNFLSKQKN